MKDYDPMFDEFPEDDPLISTTCDCDEWRRLNEACADLLRERDALRGDNDAYKALLQRWLMKWCSPFGYDQELFEETKSAMQEKQTDA